MPCGVLALERFELRFFAFVRLDEGLQMILLVCGSGRGHGVNVVGGKDVPECAAAKLG